MPAHCDTTVRESKVYLARRDQSHAAHKGGQSCAADVIGMRPIILVEKQAFQEQQAKAKSATRAPVWQYFKGVGAIDAPGSQPPPDKARGENLEKKQSLFFAALRVGTRYAFDRHACELRSAVRLRFSRAGQRPLTLNC